MLIDSHCHLDAAEFDTDRDAVASAALRAGVSTIVVPAVQRANFDAVRQLAKAHPHCHYALGIHPLYVEQSDPADLEVLAAMLGQEMQPSPVAVGEIGLDFFVQGLDKEKQTYFFTEQLKLAKRFDLPVILHVRKSVDEILKHLRLIKVRGGIAHAFNGSRQQAEILIDMGFKLGFGGVMTYPRALKIRELASTLPLEAIVLETDSPDIAPEWLGHHGRNSPDQLPAIAQVLADLRRLKVTQVAEITTKNVCASLPKIAQLCTPPHVLL